MDSAWRLGAEVMILTSEESLDKADFQIVRITIELERAFDAKR